MLLECQIGLAAPRFGLPLENGMQRLISRVALPTLVLLASAFSPVSGAPGDIKATLAAPCRYPAGLATDGRSLFVLDWRAAQVFELSPASGKVLRTLAAPTLKPQGLAYGDGKLFVCDDHTGNVYTVDARTGRVLDTFNVPDGRPAGLAYAAGALYLLDRKSANVYKVMPDDGTILQYFRMPDPGCSQLAYDGKHLWIANRVKDELYVVELEQGQVLGIVKAPGPYAAGLAWLDGCLWNVDFQTRQIYQLAICDQPMFRLSDTQEERLEFVYQLYNYGPGEIQDMLVNVALPDELPNQKLLSALAFSPSPVRTVEDRWGQKCAVFELGQVASGAKASAGYTVTARLAAIRYLILPEETGTLADIPENIRTQYTVDSPRLGVHSPYIQKTMKDIVGDEQNCYWIARRIYNYVIERLKYEMIGGWDIPEVVLKRGSGSCSEYTLAFVALCRAAGLPARYAGSVVVRGDAASADEDFHRWAQVYLPGYGWVPVDANKGDADLPADQARGFGELANRFLITTHGGGDSEYLKWGYNSYAHYQASGYCKVEEDNMGLWEPRAPTSQPTASQPVTIRPVSDATCKPGS
jgi:hypothetical protein